MVSNVDGDSVLMTALFAGKQDFLSTVEVCDYYLDKIKNRCGEDVRVFIEGTGNFRKKVATIQKYKGNRTGEKPRYFKDIREYLVNFHGATVVNDQETDDQLGLLQTEDTVQVTNDKDARQIKGWVYDFKKDDLFYVEELDGIKWFFTQMCTGDQIDNIPALKNPAKSHFKNPPNISLAVAEELLKDTTPQQQLEIVAGLFKGQYSEKWFEAMDEIATLLWIRRKGAITWQDCNLFDVKLVKG
jgi:hypothetical protein